MQPPATEFEGGRLPTLFLSYSHVDENLRDQLEGRSQENRGGAASPLSEMEEKQANQVNGKERANQIL